MNIRCPSCGSNNNICFGEVPQMNLFAGHALKIPLSRSGFLKCKDGGICLCFIDNITFKTPATPAAAVV